MQGREVDYNNEMGSNARQIIPVTMDDEVLTGNPLDILMYMNNYTIINKAARNKDVSVCNSIRILRRLK